MLAVIAALIGLAFKTVLYAIEDLCDRLWQGRPEWARPAVGGLALGLVLLALPQMYGVGYPVMYKTTAGRYALWFLILLPFGKIVATSLTLGIGGSGGVFAPSLFIGVTSGNAFGDIAHHSSAPAAGQPALYAVVAMGAVFAAAARAPLTSLASVVEMTGNFALTLPVMLAIGIAATLSRALSYGTIYTTKLLRRGTDIDRTAPWRALRPEGRRRHAPVPPAAAGPARDAEAGRRRRRTGRPWPGRSRPGDPQALFGTESLAQALRQLGPTATRACPCCPPTAARYKAGSPHPACCAPSPVRSRPPGPRPPKPSSPPIPSTPTRTRSSSTRRPRYPDTGSSRSPSRPGHPPPGASSPRLPGPRAACPCRSCAAASSARPARISPWPPATASACWPRRHSEIVPTAVTSSRPVTGTAVMRKIHGWKRLLTMTGLSAMLIAAGVTATAYGLLGHDRNYARPSGIPASIADSQVNLMGLSPVPTRPAPGFTLTDQDGRVLALSAFRGKVVVLEFMDPHCTDLCPIVSAEFNDAYHDLGGPGRARSSSPPSMSTSITIPSRTLRHTPGHTG